MTKSERVLERVEELTAGGMSQAEATRQVADEFGLKPNSVRGALYQARKKANGGTSPRSRVRETTADDAVASATHALEKALEAIDREVEAAHERAEEATREYDALKSSAETRKQAIAAKIDALKA